MTTRTCDATPRHYLTNRFLHFLAARGRNTFRLGDVCNCALGQYSKAINPKLNPVKRYVRGPGGDINAQWWFMAEECLINGSPPNPNEYPFELAYTNIRGYQLRGLL